MDVLEWIKSTGRDPSRVSIESLRLLEEFKESYGDASNVRSIDLSVCTVDRFITQAQKLSDNDQVVNVLGLCRKMLRDLDKEVLRANAASLLLQSLGYIPSNVYVEHTSQYPVVIHDNDSGYKHFFLRNQDGVLFYDGYVGISG